MTFKGHKWHGLCKKCGKHHEHPTKGKKWNHVSPLKGRPRTPETRLKISKSLTGKPSKLKGRKKSEEHKRKISEALTGHIGYWRGKTRPLITKIRISLALTGRPFTIEHIIAVRKGVRRYWHEVHATKVRKLHNLSEEIEFIPARAYEHSFARKVLIEKNPSEDFVTQSGLRSHGEWIKNSCDDNAELIGLSDIVRALRKKSK